jgi:hypothetical protein
MDSLENHLRIFKIVTISLFLRRPEESTFFVPWNLRGEGVGKDEGDTRQILVLRQEMSVKITSLKYIVCMNIRSCHIHPKVTINACAQAAVTDSHTLASAIPTQTCAHSLRKSLVTRTEQYTAFSANLSLCCFNFCPTVALAIWLRPYFRVGKES